MSRRVQAELQARADANDAETVVLVEGLSDFFALEAAAVRCGRDLRAERVDVVPMGGATNVGHFVRTYGPDGRNVRLAGLCDVGEARLFARSLERGFFVCDRDLEEELIRALGPSRVEAIIDEEGELASLRKLQQMPFHRQRTEAEHLHRFLRSRSGRNYRYAPLLVGALDPDALPRPLLDLLAFVA